MSKKRRSKAFIRRSKAAKKGWETRRKQKAASVGISIDLGKHRKHLVGLTFQQAKKKIAAEKKVLKDKRTKKRFTPKQIKTIESVFEMYEIFVTDAAPGEIRSDGAIAHSPSRLRMLPVKEKAKLLRKMRQREGDEDFDLYMYDVADEYEVEVREVYTFFFSP